jgi:hypothetical protein
MGLIGRIFGGDKGREGAGSHSTQFHESEPDSSDEEGSRNAPRRELLQVIMRDTMRKHGIPSDWIECRMLSTVNRVGRHGLHVNFVVKQAHDRLLSLGWEFQGFNAAEMPDPKTWAHSGSAPLTPMPGLAGQGFAPTQDPMQDAEPPKSDDDVQKDLAALFAIRDASMADAARGPVAEDRPDFQATQPFADSGDNASKK